MTVVRVRLTPETAELMAALRGVDAQLLMTQAKLENVQAGLNFAKGAASAAGFAIGLRMVYDEMGALVQRYNQLRSLDQAGLFFNTKTTVDALSKGMGDLTVQAVAAQTAIRFAASGAELDPSQYAKIGQFGRGLVLGGLSPDITNAMDAIFMDVVGGRSQRLHTLGVPVDNMQAYRDYARANNMDVRGLSGMDKIQAREQQLESNQAFINKSLYGEGASASGFQQAGAFIQNTKDSYVRSLAGAWEELASSIYKTATASSSLDPQRLAAFTGQTAAALTPIALAGVATGFGLPRYLGSLNQLQGAGAELSSRVAPAQQAAFNAARELEAAAQVRAEVEREFNDSGRGFVTGQRFDQWSGGTQVMNAERIASQNVASAGAKVAEVEGQVAKANQSIIATTNSMNNFLAVNIGLAVVTAAWMEYTNAVKAANAAQQSIVAAGKQGGLIAAGIKPQLDQYAAGKIPADQIIAIGQTQGNLDPRAAAEWKTYIDKHPGASSADLGNEMIRLQAAQEADKQLPEMRSNVAKKLLLSTNPALVAIAPDWFKGQVDQETEIEWKKSFNEGIRRGKAQARASVAAQQTPEQDADEAFGKLNDTLTANVEVLKLRRAAAYRLGLPADQIGQMGDDANKAEANAIVGFYPKAVELQGAEKQQYFGKMLPGAINTQITLQQQEQAQKEVKAIQDHIESLNKNIENMDKESAARSQVAKMQDELLGGSKKLLDVTNTESAARANADAVIQQYTSLVADGNQEMADQFAATHNLTGAIQLHNAAQLDMTKALRDSISSIQSGIPELLDSAAAAIRVDITGQAGLAQALAGNNKFLGAGDALRAKMQDVGVTGAQLSFEQQLLGAIQTGKMPAGLSPNAQKLIQDAMGAYSGMNMDTQGQYTRGLSKDIRARQNEFKGGLYGVLTGAVDLNGNLKGVPADQLKNLQQFLSSDTAAALSGDLPNFIQAAKQWGIPDNLINQVIAQAPQGFNPNAVTPGGISGQFDDKLTAYAADQSGLETAMFNLQGAIERMTAAYESAAAPGGARHDGSGWADAGIVGPMAPSDYYDPLQLNLPAKGGPPPISGVKGKDEWGFIGAMKNPSYRASVYQRGHAMAPGASCAACASIPLADTGAIPDPLTSTTALAAKLKAEGWIVVSPADARKADYALMFTADKNSTAGPDHVYTMMGGTAWDKGKTGRQGTTPDAYGMVPPAGRGATVTGPMPVFVVNMPGIAGKAGAGISGAAAGAISGAPAGNGWGGYTGWVGTAPQAMPYAGGQSLDQIQAAWSGYSGWGNAAANAVPDFSGGGLGGGGG